MHTEQVHIAMPDVQQNTPEFCSSMVHLCHTSTPCHGHGSSNHCMHDSMTRSAKGIGGYDIICCRVEHKKPERNKAEVGLYSHMLHA